MPVACPLRSIALLLVAGLLDFDGTSADPSLTFRLIDIDGDSVYPPAQVRASHLRNGVSL